jgi:hypothetical protein
MTSAIKLLQDITDEIAELINKNETTTEFYVDCDKELYKSVESNFKEIAKNSLDDENYKIVSDDNFKFILKLNDDDNCDLYAVLRIQFAEDDGLNIYIEIALFKEKAIELFKKL